jgi:hypothetical protein
VIAHKFDLGQQVIHGRQIVFVDAMAVFSGQVKYTVKADLDSMLGSPYIKEDDLIAVDSPKGQQLVPIIELLETALKEK